MKITINIPDKISHRDTHIASMEKHRKGLLMMLWRAWRQEHHEEKPSETHADHR